MTFVVHFTDDIGTAEQNAHLGEQLAADIESLLLGYLELMDAGLAFAARMDR